MPEEPGPTAPAHSTLAEAETTAATEEAGARLQAQYEAWWAERKAAGLSLQRNSRQIWAAMEGWQRVQTQEDWDRLYAETAEGWASGAVLLTLLGGERYIEPARAALLLHLWQHFIAAYEVDGPAEFLAVAMAVLSFSHFLRLNTFVGNLEMRLEDEFFHTDGLRGRFEQQYGRGAKVRVLNVEEIAAQLGHQALPLLDRCNRMVVRNLRLLRELKTAPLALTVANYGQLNVGQAQTNVAAPPPESADSNPATIAAPPRPRRRRKAKEGA